MATTYSDYFNSVMTVEDGTAAASSVVLASTAAAQVLDKTWTPRRGLGGGRVHAICARAVIATIGGTSADVVRMFTLNSAARIIDLRYNTAGTSTTYAADVGIYLSGAAHDGAVVDVDLFDAAAALATAQVNIDCFSLGVLTDQDRGRPLWHLAQIGGATVTGVDPGVEYDVCLTSTATLVTVIEEVVMTCLYIAG